MAARGKKQLKDPFASIGKGLGGLPQAFGADPSPKRREMPSVREDPLPKPVPEEARANFSALEKSFAEFERKVRLKNS